MQPAPPKMKESVACGTFISTSPEVSGRRPIQLGPRNSQSSFFNTPSPQLIEKVNQTIYIPELVEDEIENNTRDYEEHFGLLYEPPLDSCTREMAQLNSLRHFLQSSTIDTRCWYQLFPTIIDHLVSISLGNDSLRHSLLAAGAVIRDIFLHNPASELYLVEKAASLRLLEQAISNCLVDEIMAISLLMHINMDFLLGQLRHARRHLHSLRIIFEQMKQRAKDTGQPLSLLVSLVQRKTIGIDFAIVSLRGEPTQFESLDPIAELQDRQWLTQSRSGINKNMTSSNIEWTLSRFEIDNMMHRVYNAAKRCEEYRTSNDPQAEEKVEIEYRKLTQAVELWKQRSIIREQEEIERYARQVNKPPDDPSLRFLYHEPLHLQNIFYANLLNQWRMINIWNSLIVQPETGADPLRTIFTPLLWICVKLMLQWGEKHTLVQHGKVYFMQVWYLVGRNVIFWRVPGYWKS